MQWYTVCLNLGHMSLAHYPNIDCGVSLTSMAAWISSVEFSSWEELALLDVITIQPKDAITAIRSQCSLSEEYKRPSPELNPTQKWRCEIQTKIKKKYIQIYKITL